MNYGTPSNAFLDEALARMRADGLMTESPITDGSLQRCPVDGKPNRKDGSYIIHADDYPVAWWQNWITGIVDTYQGRDMSTLTKKEKQEYARRREQVRLQGEYERQQRNKDTAEKARKIWEQSLPASETHGYLRAKQVKPLHCRVDGQGRLIVPIHDADDQLVNLQRIYPTKPTDGPDKLLLSGGKKKGCYSPITPIVPKENTPMLIAEGFATAASLYMATGYETWIAIDCHNLLEVAKLARSKFPERKIVFCADHDKPQLPDYPNPGGIGAEKARKAANAIGGYFALCPLWPEVEKADFNDLACALGTDRVRMEIEAILAKGPVTDCPIPLGFYMTEKGEQPGLYYNQAKPNGSPDNIWLGSPVKVVARTRTNDGTDWGLLLRWNDPDGKQHEWPMPIALLNSQKADWLTVLMDGGWQCDPAYRKQIAKFFSSVKPTKRVRCVTATGWHHDRYALPDKTFGNGEDELVLQSLHHDGLYQMQGNLGDWQKLATLCVANPKLGFALSCAFAGPLLKFAGLEGGGFSFEGASSCGKTTALQVAASVWGGPKHVRTWRTTDNALEMTAALHNDNCLILDELAQVKARVLDEAVYMLVNGGGKARASKDGGLRKSYHWRVLILSSGELGLADKLMEDGRRSRAGQEARFVSIPVTTADIRDLHGMTDSDQLIRQMKRLAETYYGVAGRTFLERLTQGDTLKNLTSKLCDEIERTADKLCPAGCDGQVRRVASRFALVSVAGILARQMGILPAEFEAGEYTRICFNQWLEERGGIGAGEDMAILNQVQLFLEQHGQSRFQDVNNPDAFTPHMVGYRGTEEDVEGYVYYCLPEAFRTEVTKGYSQKRAVEILTEAGWLKTEAGRSTRQKWINREVGKKRVYQLQLPVEDV